MALMKAGYMLKVIALTQLVSGGMLLTNRLVPLALFAPFIVNAMAFHGYLEPSGRGMAGMFLLLELYLAWKYRRAFAPMLTAQTEPM